MKSVIKKTIPNPNRLAITANPTIYSPAWVIEHPKNTLAYNLELINRIKKGVKNRNGNSL